MPDAPFHCLQPFDAVIRCHGLHERILVVILLCALMRTGEAVAGDQSSVTAGPTKDSVFPLSAATTAFGLAVPGDFAPAALDAPRTFSATEFSPRRRTLFDGEIEDPIVEAPMLRGTTVWQRMSDYKSRDRVRVLTLWESNASTLSLQAGKRGDPSLQWTSRQFNRGGSTRGLLDQLFSVSIAGAGRTLHGISRPAAAPLAAAPPAPGRQNGSTPASGTPEP